MYAALLLTLSTLFNLAASLPSILTRQHSTAELLDLFYTPPAGYEAFPPGTILANRTLPTAFNSFAETIQLLTRSITSHGGDPTAVLTSIFVPLESPQPEKILSVQEPYNSADPNCGPGLTLFGADNVVSYDTIIQAALVKGWFVQAPDSEGPHAAFTNGLATGRVVLDTIRGALGSCAITGISETATVLLNGYSGGSFASEWALELLPTYAPELKQNMKGAALGGLVPNITNVYTSVNASYYNLDVPESLVGMTAEDPDNAHTSTPSSLTPLSSTS